MAGASAVVALNFAAGRAIAVAASAAVSVALGAAAVASSEASAVASEASASAEASTIKSSVASLGELDLEGSVLELGAVKSKVREGSGWGKGQVEGRFNLVE